MSKQPIGCVVVVKKGNSVLLGKRKNAYKSGFYGLPGGRVEVGEKLEVCAERELLEETGLVCRSLNYAGTVKELQDSHDFIHFVFSCEAFEGEPMCVEPDKCEGWEWHDISSLPTPILQGHGSAIELVLHSDLQYIEIT